MKQLLLRVPDDLHRRIAARAQSEGRSMNAVASEILDTAVQDEIGHHSSDRQEHARARLKAAEMLVEIEATPVSEAERRRIIESTRGWGPVIDGLLAEERDRV